MQQLVFLALVLACPLMMVFMMRGMGGGSGMSHDMSSMHTNDADKDRRVADLEREVAELRSAETEKRFNETYKR